MSASEPVETEPQRRQSQGRARARKLAGQGALITLAVLALLVVAGWLGRASIAHHVMTDWLRERGVPSEIQVERLGVGGFTGTIRAGTPAFPELVAEKVEVRYGLQPIGPDGKPGLNVREIRLVKPVVRGSLRGGKLSFGALDRVIDEFRRRPPRPDEGQPVVVVEGGALRLDSDYGVLDLRGDARIEDGKLMTLDAALQPSDVKAGQAAFAGVSGRVQLATRGDRVEIAVQGAARSFAAGQVAMQAPKFRLSIQGPYPDLKTRRGDGLVAVGLHLTSDEATSGPDRLTGVEAEARFSGRSQGWVDTLQVTGVASGTIEAQGAETGGGRAEGLTAHVNMPLAAWSRPGGDQLAARFNVDLTGARYVQGDLDLDGLTARLNGAAALGRERPSVGLTGGMAAHGRWRGLGPAKAADDPETAALKRAAQDFIVEAPAVMLDLTAQPLEVRLQRPLRLRSASGAVATVSTLRGAPLLHQSAGAFNLAVTGGGLPEATLRVDRFDVRDGRATAQADLSVEGGLAMFREAQLTAAGVLSLDADRIAFVSRGCAQLTAARMELGENDLERLSGRLCPVDGPAFAWSDGRWRLLSRLEDGAAAVPIFESRLTHAKGLIDVAGQGDAVAVKAELSDAELFDTAKEQRYFPLRASGSAELRQAVWNGRFQIADPAGRALVGGVLRHQSETGVGHADVDSGVLTFAQGGLQPAALSPAAELIGSPAEGEVRFTGEADWDLQGVRSRGVAHIARLDFRSPAGAVHGLTGDVELASLAPLVSAPDQTLRAQTVDSVATLSDVAATFRFDEAAWSIAGVEAKAGGGVARLGPMVMPTQPGTAYSGLLTLDGVELAEVVERSPFGDRVDLQAKVSGRAPFTVTAEGDIRVSDGEIHAVAPGRLSIQRAALTQVSAGGAAAPAGAPTNAITDFAYQAMEHLAFNQLAARIDSQADGRLGVRFAIDGEHSPPTRQEIRLGLGELISRKFLDRPLPLPSGTKVALNLDTSVNLDQLLHDYAAYRRDVAAGRAGSAAVQPSVAKVQATDPTGGQP